MDNQVQEIKDKVDILEVMSSYLTLKRAGMNWKGKCPFHNEKTPSMMVSPERQTFKCFGCGEGGDVFTFIEKMEGVDFYNALKILADRAGVALEHHTISYGGKEHKADKKTQLYEINNWAKKLYQKVLLDHPKAEKARLYLKGRGLTLETIKNFEIGYAPKSWDFLIKFLKGKGYTDDEIQAAGVAVKGEKGDIYDRFRGRIVFPINNPMGLSIAFTSRILEDDDKQAKYINSSESLIYSKGKTIYGLDKAKMAIKEADQVILVEGNMDVIACHQAGFLNTVATSGTALTEDQIKTLARYSSLSIFCFDSDTAGQIAFKRAAEIAVKNDISTKMIAIPSPYKDPDELLKKNSSLWQKAIDAAKPSIEYWIDLLVKKHPEMTVLDKKAIAKEILPVIKNVYSDIEKECYIKYLSTKLSITEKSLIGALQKTKSFQSGGDDLAEVKNTKLSLEEKMLGMLWLAPEITTRVEIPSLETKHKFDNFNAMLGQKMIEREKVDPSESKLLDQFALAVFEEYQTQDAELLTDELKYIIGRLKSDQRESIRSKFAAEIKQAEDEKDKEKVKKLLIQFAELIK